MTGTPAAAGLPPARAAREAFGELGADWYPGTPWDDLHEDLRAQWEAAAQAAVKAAAAQPGGMDSLYRERAHLVAHLAAIYPSCIGPAEDVGEPGWAIVYVTTPEGQMTWHIGPRDLDLFGHVRVGQDEWDGHTTAEKYARLDRLTAKLSDDEEPYPPPDEVASLDTDVMEDL